MKMLWGVELGFDPESVEDDDNFHIGGSSISAVRLAAAAQEAGISLEVADIFRNPEFSQMCVVAAMHDKLAP